MGITTAIGKIMTILDSAAFKNIKNEVDDFLTRIEKGHRLDPLSLDDLANKFSNDTDRIIIEFEDREGLKFLGGKLIVSMDQNIDFFNFKLNIYFTTEDKRVILKEVNKKMPIILLTEDSCIILKTTKPIEYEVTEPQRIQR